MFIGQFFFFFLLLCDLSVAQKFKYSVSIFWSETHSAPVSQRSRLVQLQQQGEEKSDTSGNTAQESSHY